VPIDLEVVQDEALVQCNTLHGLVVDTKFVKGWFAIKVDFSHGILMNPQGMILFPPTQFFPYLSSLEKNISPIHG
jgi:hypothetical protein